MISNTLGMNDEEGIEEEAEEEVEKVLFELTNGKKKEKMKKKNFIFVVLCKIY